MSKNVIIASVVGVVVVAVGGFFLFGSMNKPGDDQNQVSNTTETGKKMAFLDFVKQGGSYKCEVHQLINNVDTTGTTYINGGMMRGEYNTTVQGMSITSMMIMRDGYAYSWNSMMPNSGFKMMMQGNAGNTNGQVSGNYGFDANTIGDYNCEPWSADQSMFAVPTNITFQTIAN